MPVRNGVGYIEAAIESLVDQTERDIEIIVSDNASDDGTGDYLRAVAQKDPRIKYFRQESGLRAYDNFRFVLEKARGEYFMWAAHDDTRDLDFIEKLAAVLDQDDQVVLAFGDLNIVTPDNPDGTIQHFPFATTGLNRWSRLRKVSQLQCFNIYGLWRTNVVRQIPYAYCAWWPDLPMMLSAAYLGEFKHVAGTRFHYFEVPKSSLDRVKYQDFAVRFHLISGVAGLIGATYRACSQIGGIPIGIYAASLVVLKQALNLPGFIYRRVKLQLTSP